MSKTVKLNSYIREGIIDDLLAHRFGKEEAELNAAKGQLALEAYNLLFPEELRTQLAALPEGFVPTNSELRVKVDGSRSYFYLNFPDDIQKRMRSADDEKTIVLSQDNVIAVRHEELEDKEKALNEAKSLASRQAKAALNSVTTVAKLVSVWPEVAPFVQEYIDAPKPMLPALPIPSLNQMLNLGA